MHSECPLINPTYEIFSPKHVVIHLFYGIKREWSYPLKKQSMLSRQAAVHSACLSIKRSGTVSCAEKWLSVQNDSALTTPQPPDPSRQNTSTYLQERRDKKINDCTLNYITAYQASAPFVSSGGDEQAL